MTSEELRIKVAELLGWTHYKSLPASMMVNPTTGIADRVPDYPHDLNAAWDAAEAWVDEHGGMALLSGCCGDLRKATVGNSDAHGSDLPATLLCRAIVEAHEKLKTTRKPK